MNDQAILRGISVLDQRDPKWREKIDWDKLSMIDNNCILGQLFGNYVVGQAELFGRLGDGPEYGFSLKCVELKSQRFRQLTKDWKRLANKEKV